MSLMVSKTIACASDIHGMWDEIEWPAANILVLAGDILPNHSMNPSDDALRQVDSLWRLRDKLCSLKEETYAYIVIVAGNHDWIFQKNNEEARDILDLEDVFYLQDEACEIEGIKFYGAPHQPWFLNWAFNFPRLDDGSVARQTWAKIPSNTNVLVTHCPPRNILDGLMDGGNAGCPYLTDRISQLPNLKLHVFGHIHWSYGITHLNNTAFVNAAICTEEYRPTNKVRVVKLER